MSLTVNYRFLNALCKNFTKISQKYHNRVFENSCLIVLMEMDFFKLFSASKNSTKISQSSVLKFIFNQF